MGKFKLILTVLLISIISTVFAQDTTHVTGSTVYNDAKQAVTNLSPKMQDALNSLAKTLKVGATDVWDILVKQQLVWSYCYLVATILTIFSWCHFYYRMREGRAANWGSKDDNYDTVTSYHFVVGITLIIAVTGSIISIAHFQDMITGFINPKYGALKTIAELALGNHSSN